MMLMILSYWRECLIASLAICLLLLYALLQSANSSLAEKTAEIESMRREAEAYTNRSKEIADDTSNAFTLLVEQIKSKDTALKNAHARFGSCNAAHGVRADWVQPKPSLGEADVPSQPSEPSESERLAVSSEFVNACAADAAFVGAVHEWRVANGLPVQ